MNVEIAQRLSARRKQAGLSQEALAEQLGVSRQAVSKWERSESSPDTDNLIALAQLYGVSLDELLYVDDEMRDDVVFEAADRATECGSAATSSTQGTSNSEIPGRADCEATSSFAASDAGFEDKKAKVQIGFGGIHVKDGDDYVHVSWRDGVHVKNAKKGEEVHVGWNGIHVKDGSSSAGDVSAEPINSSNQTSEQNATDADVGRDADTASASTEGDRRAAGKAWASADDAREGERRAAQAWYGSSNQASATTSMQDEEWIGLTSKGVGGRDDEGNEFRVDSDGVVINGEHFDDWRDAQARYGYGHMHDERWWEPCGYTVQGERFDTMEEARAKYGAGVGTSIPVRKHYMREFEKSWLKFPYPLVVIVVYLMLGVMNGAWGMGLFLFFTIPVYYMVGHAVGRKRIVPLIAGVYPLGVIAWFCYMAFVLNQPHPAWVMFLTIPLVEWLVHSLSHWWRSRRRRKMAVEQAPVEVEGK